MTMAREFALWLKDQPEDIDALDVLAHVIDFDSQAFGELLNTPQCMVIYFSDDSVWESKYPLPAE
jgi:hypothetical protein